MPSVTSQPLQTQSSPKSWRAALWTWVRRNGFVLGLFTAVIIAFFVPATRLEKGAINPELMSDLGIALILFLQGLSMPLEKVQRSAEFGGCMSLFRSLHSSFFQLSVSLFSW